MATIVVVLTLLALVANSIVNHSRTAWWKNPRRIFEEGGALHAPPKRPRPTAAAGPVTGAGPVSAADPVTEVLPRVPAEASWASRRP